MSFLPLIYLFSIPSVVLENNLLGLSFERKTGTLVALQNKLTGETYHISGDEFVVEAEEFRLDFADAALTSLKLQGEALEARYQSGGTTIEVTYTLHGENHFAEKQIILTSKFNYGFKNLVISRPSFSAADLKIIPYRYPKFMRPEGGEPICTYFGRTPKGGFFTGVEFPFDASSVEGEQVILGYMPSLKVTAGEKLKCEPIYLGIYQRNAQEQEKEKLPLQSESDAMVAMTSAILGPLRHGLAPMACGWHSEMEHYTYLSEEAVEEEMKSLDFLAECGIDWLSDSHPWGGETEAMNSLVGDQKYAPGKFVCKFLEHAKKTGVKVAMWPTMNNTHPWWEKGEPFRPDKPEWLMSAKANCLANKPFLDWLNRINIEGLATGYYKSWVMDGSFFGDGGWPTTIIPVTCPSDKHDHLKGDSNYACERALNQLIASVRQQYLDMYIFVCRPPMDLGIWSLRNVDACFTLLESGTGEVKRLEGLTEQPLNVAAGDQIRTWSRIRVHHHFFPHYIDQPLLFPSRANRNAPPSWPSEKIDYIMLSALSCSPNQLYYIPTKTGIPDKDKAEIRRWLSWGRKNISYLKVRKDLPDWPAAGKVDGSAHIVGDRGLIFLCNPNKNPLQGEFALTEQSTGLKGKGTFKVAQYYPESEQSVNVRYGEAVSWEVLGETAVILKVQPIDNGTK